MQRLSNPYPLFVDTRGALVDAGYIYVGIAGADPRSDPIDLYIDQSLTTPIAQPLRTLGGFIVDGENPVSIYFAEDNYSVRVEDANHQLVEYAPDAGLLDGGPSYQPLSDNLTALAAIANTAYGRALLALANQAALQAAVGTPAALLAKIGGAMTGDISRSGGGVYVYWSDAGLTSGRLFLTESGASDPTSQPGDIWLEKE